MTQEVNNLSLLYKPKFHTKIALMLDPTLDLDYTIELSKGIFIFKIRFKKYKTELYTLLQRSWFETQL